MNERRSYDGAHGPLVLNISLVLNQGAKSTLIYWNKLNALKTYAERPTEYVFCKLIPTIGPTQDLRITHYKLK